jgi:hypothetical protein
MSRGAFAGLGLCAAALAGVIALEMSLIEGDQTTNTVAAAAVARWRPAPVVPTPPAPDRSREWASTALERPLFAADRRPLAEQRPAAAGGREPPRLTGVLVGPAGRTAIFAGAAEGAKPVVVREGDSLGTFEVKTILAGQVTLVGPEGERVLRPSFDPRGGGAAPIPPNGPGPGPAPARQPAQAQPTTAGTAAGAGRGIGTGFVPAGTPSAPPVRLPPGFPIGGQPR